MTTDVRLIDANVLLKEFEARQELINSGTEYSDCFRNNAQELSTEWWCVEDAVLAAPTIEAEPVRHGRWGEAEIVGYNGYHAVYARPCMLCGSYTREHKPPYCSNCGAKMDAKEGSACD